MDYKRSGNTDGVIDRGEAADRNGRKPFVDSKLAYFLSGVNAENEKCSKVVDENGEPQVVYRRDDDSFTVFKLDKTQQNEDGITLGPMSAHVKDLTDAWIKKQDLTVTSDGKVFSTRSDNSATDQADSGDNAEGNSPKNVDSISNFPVGDNGVREPRGQPM